MSKRDLSAVNLQTYVFDGEQYLEIAYALLSAPGVEEWYGRIIAKPQRLLPR